MDKTLGSILQKSKQNAVILNYTGILEILA